jgi:hypothetical protein
MPDAKRRRDLDELSRGPSAAQELFSEDAPPASEALTGGGKSFAECLRTTPARPLSGAEKGMLTAAGVVVALLLAASLFKVAS